MRLPLRVLADSTGWVLASWLVVPGARVYRNQRVAALRSASTGAMDHALAPREGTLERILVSEGSYVNNTGDTVPDFTAAIAVIEFCPHSVVYQGLCAVCGEEAVVSHFANVNERMTRLPVAYNARTLSVTRAEAESVAYMTAQQLLRERRLLLVLDLDHTLVHATDDPRASAVLEHSPNGCDVSSVASFSLAPSFASTSGPLNSRMHLKLRPHLSEFLSRCAALFELHIYTMGSRPYADRVAELIDPEKRLFSGRITSREDFEEGRSNQKNISRLFPCDDSMVLIIDDREDVWVSGTGASFMPNLIRAKPYYFFSGLHEAYDRALSSETESRANCPAPDDALGSVLCSAVDSECTRAKIAHVSATGSSSKTAAEQNEMGSQTGGVELNEPRHGLRLDPALGLSDELRKLVCQWWECDSSSQGWNKHLLRLASILEMCHRRFFANVPVISRNEVPAGPIRIPADIKDIVSDIRAGILDGCVLTFTGVFPLTIAPEQSDIWKLAIRHGALCHHEFILGVTTHVIASPERGLCTEKTKAAIESEASYVVDVSWLEDSAIQFERRPEMLYNLLVSKQTESFEAFRTRMSAAFARASEQRRMKISLGSTVPSPSPARSCLHSCAPKKERVGNLKPCRRPESQDEDENLHPRKSLDGNPEHRLLDAEEADLALDEAFEFEF